MESATWTINELEIKEGFLNGLRLDLHPGLTCIIGPRGSGKSTLASALRYAISGLDNASKQRLDLFKANLGRSVVSLQASRADGSHYSVRREGRNPAILTMADGRALPSVDLDRGTFLPLDAYSAGEIEDIANEELGPRRRVLLDQLKLSEHRVVMDRMAASKRDLDANADELRALDRQIHTTLEERQGLADANDKMKALPPQPKAGPQVEPFQVAARQDQQNRVEAAAARTDAEALERLTARTADLLADLRKTLAVTGEEPTSTNRDLLEKRSLIRAKLLAAGERDLASLKKQLEDATGDLTQLADEFSARHLQQAAEYAKLRETNEEAGKAAKERAEVEQAVLRFEAIGAILEQLNKQREELIGKRKSLRAAYIKLCDELSELRSSVASELQLEAGTRVRISVRRSADRTEYLLKLAEGLKGAGVTRHENIIEAVSRLRPDELAQLITARQYDEFESATKLEPDRARRVLDSFRATIDPFELETMRPDDMVSIQLNVGGRDNEILKDASKLSQGQKCTALLPLLLARRSVPLIIDQPEDNLDNHFIYETVVQTVARLKAKRQMVFVTHNANIPVLAEADLIVVLGSDGSVGRVEKLGNLDECRGEIIDLLEGGEEAFELRRRRYERD